MIRSFMVQPLHKKRYHNSNLRRSKQLRWPYWLSWKRVNESIKTIRSRNTSTRWRDACKRCEKNKQRFDDRSVWLSGTNLRYELTTRCWVFSYRLAINFPSTRFLFTLANHAYIRRHAYPHTRAACTRTLILALYYTILNSLRLQICVLWPFVYFFLFLLYFFPYAAHFLTHLTFLL